MAIASPEKPTFDAVFGFAENRALAGSLASRLGLPYHEVELHRFPDGETRVRVAISARAPIVMRSLDSPNDKLVEILLCAGALRSAGARQICLLAPYLCYMRQDVAFTPGEAVSQKILGAHLASAFDAFVSVDPHLHRTASLSDVFLGRPARALTAAPAIARYLQSRSDLPEYFLIGPDEESRPWVEAVAKPLGAPWVCATKRRAGDRSVEVTLPDEPVMRGRLAIVVDDVVSTGETLAALARHLTAADAAAVEACVTHALFTPKDHEQMTAAGVRRIVSTSTVAHPTNAIDIVPEIAEGFIRWP